MANAINTLGDRLLDDMQKLMRRHRPAVAWRDPLAPVIARGNARAGQASRFERHDGVPRPLRAAAVASGEPKPAEEDTIAVETLAPPLRDRLRALVGPEVDRAYLHTDRAADAVARAEAADAVTVGEHIFFRSGRYAPQSPAGRGLLAHELTHVAESTRPGAGARRASPEGVRAEERLAVAREQRLAGPDVSPLVAPALAAAGAAPMMATAARPAPPATAGPSPDLQPMRADEDRPPPLPPPVLAAVPAFDAMRRGLFRDLMSQLRVEFERGA